VAQEPRGAWLGGAGGVGRVVYSRDFMDAYHRLRDRARQLFDDSLTIYCPYFSERVVLNGEGFHHLRYSAERERSKREQMLKFRLLPLALDVILKSGAVQEYRRIWQAIGKPRADGMRAAKEVEYWGFVAIIGPRPDKLRVILRRVGTGNVTFWSVMRGSKILLDGRQRLAPENLEAD
jgi:hypothetical protein